MNPVDDISLVLAAEEFEAEEFDQKHRFSRFEERIISKLMLHGPVLLRGGRGTGKSALMIKACRNLELSDVGSIGLYTSFRYVQLLHSKGVEYEKFFCKLLISRLRECAERFREDFAAEPNVVSVRNNLDLLSAKLKRRFVLLFDDVAHLGRETSLETFFDMFRTLSSENISCKASIYPGVTRFGLRFDIFNDASVVDINRNEDMPGFREHFAEVMTSWFGDRLNDAAFAKELTRNEVAGFLGLAVLGNMRAFIKACHELYSQSDGIAIGFPQLNKTLLELSANHYWPLIDEVRAKLGIYEPMFRTAQAIAEILFTDSAKGDGRRSAIIHRDITERLSKAFEILEYTGFISKREASRAMKSGGRGARYALNLCNLMEKTHGGRLTRELFAKWTQSEEPQQFQKTHELQLIEVPALGAEGEEIAILNESIDRLRKSEAYPWGLTDARLAVLKEAGYTTIGLVASATDEQLMALHTIKEGYLRRIRAVIGQAIWM
jgi:hypothetical protein